MKAITIRQPFASLIMAGIKTLETRSRATNIRGRVLIHSALQFGGKAPFFGTWEDSDLEPFLVDMLIKQGAFYDHEFEGKYANLPRGKILGSVEITDCIPAGEWCEARVGKGNESREDYDREFALGDLSSDRFVWVLKDPQPWSTPFACKGQQGFWNAGKFAEIVDLM